MYGANKRASQPLRMLEMIALNPVKAAVGVCRMPAGGGSRLVYRARWRLRSRRRMGHKCNFRVPDICCLICSVFALRAFRRNEKRMVCCCYNARLGRRRQRCLQYMGILYIHDISARKNYGSSGLEDHLCRGQNHY